MIIIGVLAVVIPSAYADVGTGIQIHVDNLSFNVAAVPVNISYTINTTGTGQVILEVLSPDNTSIRNIDCGDKDNGSYNASWDGKDNNGTAVPSGNYTIMASYYPDNFTINGIWGSTGIGDGQFLQPSGIAIDNAGNVYVADYGNDQIQKFDPSGKFLLKWGGKGEGNGEFDYPAAVAVDGSGNVYVVDLGNSRVQVFTSDGEYLTQWGTQGSDNSQFDMPHGIAIDNSGNVYVADMGNSRIQKFTDTGNYLGGWGQMGRGNGSFIYPVGVAVDGNNNVYVTDIEANRIQEFTSGGQYLGSWGSTGNGPNEFNGADGIAIDRSGYIYISDMNNHRIQKFTPDGVFAGSINLNSMDAGKDISPAGIAVNNSDNIYVTDFSNNAVQSLTYNTRQESAVLQNQTSITLDTGMSLSDMSVSALSSSVEQGNAVAPVTTLNLTGLGGNNSWYRSNVTVTLNATDNSGSGIQYTDYSFDNKTWYTYNGPFNITNEGTTTIFYYSVDNQNDVEQVESSNVRIDKTPPTIIGYATTNPVEGDWYTGAVTVHFIANDVLSGVISVTPNQTISSDGPGQLVQGTAVDLAGNVNTTNVTLNIDNKPPVTTSALNGTMGNNGWYTSNVQVTFLATDGNGSGVKSTQYSLDGANWDTGNSLTLTSEGLTTVYYRSIDEVGNVESTNITQIKIDKTPPSIIGYPLTSPNVNGWYKGNVTVHFTATDSISGVANVTPDQNLTQDGAYQSVIGDATDNAGNTASTLVGGINIDNNPPVTTCSLSGNGGVTGSNTWYRTNVTVTLTAKDTASGVNYTMYRVVNNSSYNSGWLKYSGPFMVYGEGNTSVSYYSVDNVGNVETSNTTQVRIDMTPPVIYATILAQPGISGWYTNTVIVHFTATDDLSGVGSITPDIYLSTNGPNQSVTGYAYDMAGNMNSTTISGINISMGAPTTMCALNRTPDADGWLNSSVTVSLSAFNNTGPATSYINYSFDGTHWQKYTQQFIVSPQGNNVLYYYSVNNIGQVEPLDATNIKIDETNPKINYVIQGGNQVNGWYTQNVTVHFIASDPISGIKNVTPDVLLTKDGADQIVNGTAMNLADNSASVSTTGINIDQNPPITNCTLAGTMGKNGWYTTPVTVTLNATDGNGSGINQTWYSLDNSTWTEGNSFSLSSDGIYTIYYYSIDNVGHQETTKTQTLKIDSHAPLIQGYTLTQPTAQGWFNTSVTVHFNATDNMSGLAYVTPDQTLLYNGANQQVPGYATDNAGNIAKYTVSGINIDTQVPNTTCSLSGTNGTNGWYISPVEVTLSASDITGAMINTYHSSDDKTWYTSNPFSITNQGNTTIFYYSVDGANNTEAVKTVNLNIDDTPPTITCNVSGTMGTPDAYRSNVAVSFSASDSGGSGLANAQYSLNSANWTPITNLSFTTDGTYNLQYRAFDNAGNIASGSQTIIIDRSIPQVNYTNPQDNGEDKYVDQSIIATFSEPMDPSTINNSTFTIESTDGNPVNGSIQYTQNGNNYSNVSFQPYDSLEPETMYTATISSDVADIAGNKLASPYTWSFTTGNQAMNGGNITTFTTPTPMPTPTNMPSPTAVHSGGLPVIGQLSGGIIPLLLAFLAIVAIGGAAIIYLFYIRK